MDQSVGSVDSSFFLGRYGRRSVQNVNTGIRRMERGVSLPSSNPLGGSNFRESLPIEIKSYPAIALLNPGSGYARSLDCLSRLAIALLSPESAYAPIVMKL
jgi:hypothetical protein